MKSRSLPFVVGIFVIVSIALIVAMTLFFGGSEYLKPKVYAETIVTQSVSGLTVGSPVKFRGVPVGQVKAIGFVIDGGSATTVFLAPVRVQMELDRALFNVDNQREFDEEVASGVKDGLRAQVTVAGLTGGLVIEMAMLDPVAFPEPALPAGYRPEHAYLPAAPGLLTEFIARATTVVEGLSKVDFEGISERLKTLLANGNTLLDERIAPAVEDAKDALHEIKTILADQRIDGIITNVDEITGSLAGAFKGESSTNLREFIAELPKIGVRVREVADHLDAIVANPKIPGILDSLEKGVGPTLTSIRQAMDRVDRLVASEQFDVRELVSSLRSLVANLDQLSSELKSDPARLIFSKPPKPIEPKPVPAAGGHP